MSYGSFNANNIILFLLTDVKTDDIKEETCWEAWMETCIPGWVTGIIKCI